MLKTLTFAAALMFAASSVSAAPMLDAKGKCRDHGKFVTASHCKTSVGHCRDMKTKRFAKCGAPNTEALPAKK